MKIKFPLYNTVNIPQVLFMGLFSICENMHSTWLPAIIYSSFNNLEHVAIVNSIVALIISLANWYRNTLFDRYYTTRQYWIFSYSLFSLSLLGLFLSPKFISLKLFFIFSLGYAFQDFNKLLGQIPHLLNIPADSFFAGKQFIAFAFNLVFFYFFNYSPIPLVTLIIVFSYIVFMEWLNSQTKIHNISKKTGRQLSQSNNNNNLNFSAILTLFWSNDSARKIFLLNTWNSFRIIFFIGLTPLYQKHVLGLSPSTDSSAFSLYIASISTIQTLVGFISTPIFLFLSKKVFKSPRKTWLFSLFLEIVMGTAIFWFVRSPSDLNIYLLLSAVNILSSSSGFTGEAIRSEIRNSSRHPALCEMFWSTLPSCFGIVGATISLNLFSLFRNPVFGLRILAGGLPALTGIVSWFIIYSLPEIRMRYEVYDRIQQDSTVLNIKKLTFPLSHHLDYRSLFLLNGFLTILYLIPCCFGCFQYARLVFEHDKLAHFAFEKSLQLLTISLSTLGLTYSYSRTKAAWKKLDSNERDAKLLFMIK